MNNYTEHPFINVFVTGMLRSGTTLLDKLLDGMDDARVLSQPFSFFFREAKKRFHKDIFYKGSKYLLNDYFFEEQYSLDGLTKYLRSFEFSRDEINEVFKKITGYSGKYDDTSFLKQKLNNSSYPFIDLFNTLLSNIDTKKSENALRGFKEVQCEEFIPTFVNNGWKTIIILRNPYDVLTSIQFGRGNQYTGKKRPTLFHLRNWRKSANLSILFNRHENFQLIKYEDLIEAPKETLNTILTFLDYPISCESLDKIIKNNLKNWEGNSSFDTKQNTINKNAIGRYKKKMPLLMQEYISKLCEPELYYFGYEVIHNTDYNPYSFKEPFEIDQEDFLDEKDFSGAKHNINLEMYRLNLIKGNIISDNKLLQTAFIDPYIYTELRKVYS